MIKKEKCIVMDIDGTICKIKSENEDYINLEPIHEIINKLHEYKKLGFHIILYSSRNMNTFDGNLGLINAHTIPVLIKWLRKHHIPFDELYCGKPWPGKGGFYVDDKTIRPNEFIDYNYTQILNLISND